MSDLAEVEQANARFYQAFETLDLARMDQVWAHGEHVQCCLLYTSDAADEL